MDVFTACPRRISSNLADIATKHPDIPQQLSGIAASNVIYKRSIIVTFA
jgi:hypothetical protein